MNVKFYRPPRSSWWSQAMALAGILLAGTPVFAEVTLPQVLGSHMVLQRGVPVPIWGKAPPGQRVTVTFRDQSQSAVADAQGNWRATLDPLSVGTPGTMTIHADTSLTLEDVLVGEVWLGSGQSNMDTDVNDYVAHDAPLAAAAEKTYPQLRLYRSDRTDGWQVATAGRNHAYSAQLFYFGMLLQKKLNVPVGVIEAAVRGTPTANWITDDALNHDASVQAAIANYTQYHPYEPIEKRNHDGLADWEAKVKAAKTQGVPDDKLPQKPWLEPRAGVTFGTRGDLYAKLVQPLIPFAIRGVLWDQGEGGTNVYGINPDVVFPVLIKSWRSAWKQGDFPFLYLQKPSGGGCALHPNDPINMGCAAATPLPAAPPQRYWDADGRLQYLRIMETPNTFMVITSDLATGVHPPNKSGYATRDVQVALGGAYKQDVETFGPMLKAVKVEGPAMRITFSHVGKGLVASDNKPPQGFEIAGEDRHFFWADARIDGKAVVVSSPDVAKPVAVRYAWSWSFTWATLFNADGLPAQTFRSDDWW